MKHILHPTVNSQPGQFNRPLSHFHRVCEKNQRQPDKRKKLSARYVSYPCLIFHDSHYLVRKLSRDLRRINSSNITIQSLPLRNPRLRRIGKCDESFEDLGCAVEYSILRALKVQEIFAVWTAFSEESLWI